VKGAKDYKYVERMTQQVIRADQAFGTCRKVAAVAVVCGSATQVPAQHGLSVWRTRDERAGAAYALPLSSKACSMASRNCAAVESGL